MTRRAAHRSVGSESLTLRVADAGTVLLADSPSSPRPNSTGPSCRIISTTDLPPRGAHHPKPRPASCSPMGTAPSRSRSPPLIASSSSAESGYTFCGVHPLANETFARSVRVARCRVRCGRSVAEKCAARAGGRTAGARQRAGKGVGSRPWAGSWCLTSCCSFLLFSVFLPVSVFKPVSVFLPVSVF